MKTYKVKRFSIDSTDVDEALLGTSLATSIGAGITGGIGLSKTSKAWDKHWGKQLADQEKRAATDKLSKKAMKLRAKEFLKKDKLYKSGKKYKTAAAILGGTALTAAGAHYLKEKYENYK